MSLFKKPENDYVKASEIQGRPRRQIYRFATPTNGERTIFTMPASRLYAALKNSYFSCRSLNAVSEPSMTFLMMASTFGHEAR